MERTIIKVEALVNASIDKVWMYWTTPEHVMHWNNASADWHTPSATNDLRKDGRFCYHMAAKDGSFAFDFEGVYQEVKEKAYVAYTIADGRKVEVIFATLGGQTKVEERFEAENQNPVDLQQSGWQAILNNFKVYVESN